MTFVKKYHPWLYHPTYYTAVEGGTLTPWHGNTVSEKELDQRANGPNPTVIVCGVEVHSLLAIVGETLAARWDCVNGQTDGVMKEEETTPCRKGTDNG